MIFSKSQLSLFPDFNIYSAPILFLSLQGLFFAGLLLFRFFKEKELHQLFIGLILLITCYHQTSYVLGFMGWYDTYKTTKINYFLIDMSLALAPLIYLFIRSISTAAVGFQKRELLHFIPFIILVFIKIGIYLFDSHQDGFDSVQNGWSVVNVQWKYLDPLLVMVSIVQMVVYLVLSFQMFLNYREKIRQFFSNAFKHELNWLFIFLVVYTVLFTYQSLQIFVNFFVKDLSWRQEWWYYFFTGLVIIWVGMKSYFTDLGELKNTDLEEYLSSSELRHLTSVNNDFKKTGSNNSEKLKSIELFMNSERPFLDPQLNLVSLSKQLKMTREELSEIVNNDFGFRFNDFINRYRVDEFKSRVRNGDHQSLSLLGLAFECGFNSKTTFNRTFKKHENSSPTQYIQSLDS